MTRRSKAQDLEEWDEYYRQNSQYERGNIKILRKKTYAAIPPTIWEYLKAGEKTL